ncbi:MAG: DegV family protein [Chloroflexota bacterium]|nr:DegV family protein [Chloroflexota bacterium]
MAIKIVTDSTSDLNPDLAKDLDILVVPVNVHFGQESFRDGVELSTDQFFEKLVSSREVPTTSAPSPGTFLEVYRPLVEAGHQIVSIHISDKVSATLDSARQAASQLSSGDIHIIDSMQVSMSLGLQVITAAESVKEGANLEEILEKVETASNQVQILAIFDTLEFLKRGGRVGKARALIGSLLRMKPMLTVREGEVASLGVSRSRAQGVEYLVNIAKGRAPLKKAAVFYSTSNQEAEEVLEQMKPLVESGNVIVSRLGAALGVHSGPGAWGIAIQSDTTESSS